MDKDQHLYTCDHPGCRAVALVDVGALREDWAQVDGQEWCPEHAPPGDVLPFRRRRC